MGITRQQALDCLASVDLVGIGMEADAVRRRLHPEGVVTYSIDRNLPPTSFDLEPVFAEVQHSIELGATGIASARHAATPGLATLEHLFTGIKQRFGNISLHCLSAADILHLSAANSTPASDILRRLQAAGLDSLPGDNLTADTLPIHRAAHQLGISTTASLAFGAGETLDQRVDHLEALYNLQQETGGFTAFTPLPFYPTDPALAYSEATTAIEYLKNLAVSRMFLDNILNIESSHAAQGLKVLQMTLRFGANDVGSVMLDEATGPATEEELRRIIRDAGFKPVQRDTLYRTFFLN